MIVGNKKKTIFLARIGFRFAFVLICVQAQIFITYLPIGSALAIVSVTHKELATTIHLPTTSHRSNYSRRCDALTVDLSRHAI